jgi:hypothetical protein
MNAKAATTISHSPVRKRRCPNHSHQPSVFISSRFPLQGCRTSQLMQNPSSPSVEAADATRLTITHPKALPADELPRHNRTSKTINRPHRTRITHQVTKSPGLTPTTRTTNHRLILISPREEGTSLSLRQPHAPLSHPHKPSTRLVPVVVTPQPIVQTSSNHLPPSLH